MESEAFKKELKQMLISVRNVGFITPVFERIMLEIESAKAEKVREVVGMIDGMKRESPKREDYLPYEGDSAAFWEMVQQVHGHNTALEDLKAKLTHD